MPSGLAQMLDLGALAIVLAGTFLATAARCGWRDLMTAAKALGQIGASQFDESKNRIALARTLREIDRKGHLCADVLLPPDPSLSLLIKAYLKRGSLDALRTARRAERAGREVARAQAVRTFEYAGELAPVFGLVGTLFAITQLTPAAGISLSEATMSSIATAVLSSLYGVLTAHLICIPLARAIERKGEREEAAREAMVSWITAHLCGEDDIRPNPISVREVA